MSNGSHKKNIATLPIIGTGAQFIKSIIKLPKHTNENSHKLAVVDGKFDEIAQHIARNGQDVRSVSLRIDELNERFETMIQNQDNIQKQLVAFSKSKIQNPQHDKSKNNQDKSNTRDSDLFANDHLLDVFYTRFEDRFKDTAETKKLHKQYQQLFTDAKVNFKKFPVLDIGCGRGEFLEYMRELKINAHGVDINTDMVERANNAGLKVVQGDALDYLEESKARSIGAITGFHIVEHITFQMLLKMLSSAYSSLAPGGFALFETPNPENIIVATNSFYFDPSHLKPIPPGLLAFALEVTGFKQVEIIRSYPVKTVNDEGLNPEVFERFYGPRNYAVVGYK